MFSIGLGVTKITVISITLMVMDFFQRLKNHLLIIGSREIWNYMTWKGKFMKSLELFFCKKINELNQMRGYKDNLQHYLPIYISVWIRQKQPFGLFHIVQLLSIEKVTWENSKKSWKWMFMEDVVLKSVPGKIKSILGLQLTIELK